MDSKRAGAREPIKRVLSIYPGEIIMTPLRRKLRTRDQQRIPLRSMNIGLPVLIGVAVSMAPLCSHAAAHPNPHAAQDEQTVRNRGDVVKLPAALKNALGELAEDPHSYLPLPAFSAADQPSQLFQYYLLDTKNFQPNIFTAVIPGINDGAIPTAANAANGQLETRGAVRVVLEPKPGAPTDPNEADAFIDVFTDISGLFVINNESGWYEGWMIHDLVVPTVANPRNDGHAAFGKLTAADAMAVAAMGD